MCKKKNGAGGAGSGVYKNPQTGSWCFRVVRDRNYKRSGFKTRAEATAARVDFIRDLESAKPGAASITFSKAFELYISEGTLTNAAGTITKRRSVYLNHIDPVFGKRKINSAEPGEISLFLESCYMKGDAFNSFACGYSYGYVESFLKCFYAVFSFCYKRKLISREQYVLLLEDSSCRIKMPRMRDDDALKRRRGARVYSDEEIEAMRTRISASPLKLAFEIGLNCGLRLSEVFALTWHDIDLDGRTLSVNKQMLKIDGVWCFCQPKYLSSYRKVYINSRLLEILNEEKHRRSELHRSGELTVKENLVCDKRLRICETIKVSDFLLINNCGQNFNPESFKGWSQIFRTELRIKDFTFHALRHTFCSRIAATNCPVSELCRLAGHKSIETTMKYYINSTELAEQAARSALEKI